MKNSLSSYLLDSWIARIFLFLAFFAVQPLRGQWAFRYDYSVPVINNSSPMDLPWAGGLDYVQFSEFDFDYDGDLDLFLFDRSRDNIRVFTHEVQGATHFWKAVENPRQYFPSDLVFRATMVDYNGDGKADLFVSGPGGGFKVYRNTGDAINGIQWTLAKDLIYSTYFTTYTALYASSADVPAIADIDFDGDVDILTFQISGSHVEYHKNLSMETYGHADSLLFELRNECWGKFAESPTNNSIILDYQFSPCVGGGISNPEIGVVDPWRKPNNPKMHSGSTLTAIDIDNSGVMDLVLGDIGHNNLTLLINGGTAVNTNSAMISQNPAFPANTVPADLYLFPAAFFVDIDFDGVKDLVVGANAKNVSKNERSILYYRNVGSNALPQYSYITDALFQEEMIDHGEGSIPVFADYDNDGLVDMFVANFYRFLNTTTKESTIAWYKNTGSATAPQFTFIDYDFANLSGSGLGLRLVPAFGDLNGDGRLDMVLGDEFGNVHFLAGQVVGFAAPQLNMQDASNSVIDVGTYAHPQLVDLDEDGRIDLVIGAKTGEIFYYRNVGTTSAPSFQLVSNMLGGVDIDTQTPEGYCAPHFFKKNGEWNLFVGGNNGKIAHYNNIAGNLTATGVFSLVDPEVGNIQVEGYASCAVLDLDNDGLLNLFVGQDLGGVYHLEEDNAAGLSSWTTGFSVELFPNPNSGEQLTLRVEGGEFQFEVFTMMGAKLIEGAGKDEIQIDLSTLAHGNYLVKITSQGTSVSKRLVVY